jgi:hypothetical protein
MPSKSDNVHYDNRPEVKNRPRSDSQEFSPRAGGLCLEAREPIGSQILDRLRLY